MTRHRDEQSRWPDYLPFEPMAAPDEAHLYTAILFRLMNLEPSSDYDALSKRTERIVTSLAFLGGHGNQALCKPLMLMCAMEKATESV
jgi:hypothetical protein